jgi:hypothetical protein
MSNGSLKSWWHLAHYPGVYYVGDLYDSQPKCILNKSLNLYNNPYCVITCAEGQACEQHKHITIR